jgi:2-polyprenyl-6-methoxyphenol hydroxylase-like FAD-dependent oxidoreductase
MLALGGSSRLRLQAFSLFSRKRCRMLLALATCTIDGGAPRPTTQHALALLGVTNQLEEAGHFMPNASYRDSAGNLLAKPANNFADQFPVLCLHRNRLLRILHDACVDSGVEIRSGISVTGYCQSGEPSEGIKATLSDNTTLDADLIVGADGIHSKVRRQLLGPAHAAAHAAEACGYTYFRATLPTDSPALKAEGRGGAGWHSHSFEMWGSGQRFGYVPLKPPEAFWFGSIPTDQVRTGPCAAAATGTGPLDGPGKAWLLDRFAGWGAGADAGPEKGEAAPEALAVQRLIAATPAHEILRTDISKVPNVRGFAWHGEGGRVILLGDACHATAPNLAQGVRELACWLLRLHPLFR